MDETQKIGILSNDTAELLRKNVPFRVAVHQACQKRHQFPDPKTISAIGSNLGKRPKKRKFPPPPLFFQEEREWLEEMAREESLMNALERHDDLLDEEELPEDLHGLASCLQALE